MRSLHARVAETLARAKGTAKVACRALLAQDVYRAAVAAAAERMVANMIYDPNLHAGRGGGGGYTMNAPGVLESERARIAAAIKEATG